MRPDDISSQEPGAGMLISMCPQASQAVGPAKHLRVLMLADAAGPMSLVESEQYLDFLQHRMFRQTLLCHADVTLDRVNLADKASRLYASALIQTETEQVDVAAGRPETFRGTNGSLLTTEHPLSKAALVYLNQVWPQVIDFDSLQSSVRSALAQGTTVMQHEEAFAEDTRQLAETLLAAFSAGIAQFHSCPPKFVTEISERPSASALARIMAQQNGQISTISHGTVSYDEMTRFLLRQLDGTRTRDELVEVLYQFTQENQVVMQRAGRPVTAPTSVRALLAAEMEPILTGFARSGLLQA